jgi:hypothetical protein
VLENAMSGKVCWWKSKLWKRQSGSVWLTVRRDLDGENVRQREGWNWIVNMWSTLRRVCGSFFLDVLPAKRLP